MAYTTAQLRSALLMVDGRATEGGIIDLPPGARLLLDVISEGQAEGDFLNDLETAVAEAKAARDEAVDISNISTPDALVAALVPTSSESATATALAGMFGAGITVRPPASGRSTALIQAAIDKGHSQRAFGATTVYVVGAHEVDVAQGGIPGVGALCLNLKDGVFLAGTGTIKVANGAAEGSGVVVTNTSATITNAGILGGLTIDGNRSGNPASVFANACLFGASGCRFDKVTSVNAGYVGLMMRGDDGERNWITDCLVADCDYIGIQGQKNNGLVVRGNQVYNCGDNGIDIEGNDPAAPSSLGFGGLVHVEGNTVRNCLNGCFLESTGQAIVRGNFFYDIDHGVILNRINSGSYEVTITDNIMKNQPGSHGTAGVIVINASGKALIANNTFDGFTNSIRAQVAELLSIGFNTHRNIDKYLVSAQAGANRLVKSFVGRQVYEGGQTNGLPKTINNVGDSRLYNVLVDAPAMSLELGGPLRDTYYYKSTTTVNNGAWGAYAIFFGGETVVYITANIPAVGEYVKINGAHYYVRANAGGEVKLGNPTTQAAGNFAAAVNGLYPVSVYAANEYTEMVTAT